VQIAVAAGARVTGVASRPKHDFVRSMGAAEVVDHRTEDPLTRGPFDAIVDIAGNTPLRRLRRALLRDGRLVIVGGDEAGRLFGGLGRSVGAALLTRFVRHDMSMLVAAEDAQRLGQVVELIHTGALRPTLSETYPLEDVAAALADLEAGRTVGKIAIVP
jgi:NADPH:quinone reductase-like Zn-dependent oxidoreductase